MRTRDLALALEAWAAAVLDINTFPEDPNEISKAMPVVVCAIQSKVKAASVADLEDLGRFQQTYVKAWTAELMLMVAPEPVHDATQTLYDYTDDLEEAIRDDPTLGGRVHRAARPVQASFDPPEIQHQDGTIARVATFTMTVGEPSEVK